MADVVYDDENQKVEDLSDFEIHPIDIKSASPEVQFAIEFDNLISITQDDDLSGRIDDDTRYFESPSGTYYETQDGPDGEIVSE